MSGFVRKFKAFFRSSENQASSSEPTLTNPQQAAPLRSPLTETFPEVNLPRYAFSEDLKAQYFDSVFSVNQLDFDEPETTEKKLVQQVSERLSSQEVRLKSVPRLPSVIPQLLRSLRDPNASAKDQAEIVKRDPVIAGAVLKMVNSVYYNPTNKVVNSFQRAIVMLGVEGMRSILSGAVMQPIIHTKSTYIDKFGSALWDHSIECAVTCQQLAEGTPIEPFKAYLVGLVHDIGTITAVTQFNLQYQKTFTFYEPPVPCLIDMIERNGLKLSAEIAKDWDLPEDIICALQEQITAKPRSAISELGRILFVANHACEIYRLYRSDYVSLDKARRILKEAGAPSDLFYRLSKLYQFVEA